MILNDFLVSFAGTRSSSAAFFSAAGAAASAVSLPGRVQEARFFSVAGAAFSAAVLSSLRSLFSIPALSASGCRSSAAGRFSASLRSSPFSAAKA